MKKLITLLLACVSLGASAQLAKEPSILAGPMNGYSEHTEALVWVQTKCAKTIAIEYQLKGTKGPGLVQTETTDTKSFFSA